MDNHCWVLEKLAAVVKEKSKQQINLITFKERLVEALFDYLNSNKIGRGRIIYSPPAEAKISPYP